MYCQNCGLELKEEAVFCENCGTKVAKENKNSFVLTIKNVMRVLAAMCLAFVFCPTFLVSCNGQEVDVSVMTAVKGVKMYGETVADPYPIMLICLLIPIAIMVVLFLKNMEDKKVSLITLAGMVANFIIWIVFKSSVKNYAEENYCDFSTTAWFYFNMITMTLLTVMALLLVLKKIEMDTDLLFLARSQEAKALMSQAREMGGKFVDGTVKVTTTVAKKVKDAKLLDKAKAIPEKAYAAIVAGIVLFIGVICIAIAPPTINLNDYLVIEASGYDGYGRVEIRIDWDSMEEDYGDKLKLKTKQSEAHTNFWGVMDAMDVLREDIDIDYEWASDWSNGDKVKYTWDVSKYISEQVKCKVKYKDGSFKVKKLQEVEKFDAFEMLSVDFLGVEGKGKVAYEYGGKYLTTKDFSCNKIDGLKEGDTVTISIDDMNPEYYLETYGSVPKELEKTYTVPELGRYINSTAEMTEEFTAKLNEDAKNTLFAYVKDYYNESSHLTEVMYEGQIFLATNKPNTAPTTHNVVYILYSGNVTSATNSFKETKVYFPVKITNVHVMDGELKYENVEGIVGTTYLESNSWLYSYSTGGYADPYLCYQELVSYELADYVAEVTGGFENYAQ